LAELHDDDYDNNDKTMTCHTTSGKSLKKPCMQEQCTDHLCIRNEHINMGDDNPEKLVLYVDKHLELMVKNIAKRFQNLYA